MLFPALLLLASSTSAFSEEIETQPSKIVGYIVDPSTPAYKTLVAGLLTAYSNGSNFSLAIDATGCTWDRAKIIGINVIS